MLIDPRVESARIQLNRIKKVIPVLSVKGGVGKSTLTVMLSLALKEMGYRVGALDIDFSNPSLHMLYGVDPREVRLEEEDGFIAPLTESGVRLSTSVFFTRGEILPSRSKDSLEAMLELLASTNWADTEVLLIDTPPGLRDEQLRLLSLLSEIYDGDIRAVVVVTPFHVAIENVMRSMSYINSIFSGQKILVVNRHSAAHELNVGGDFGCELFVPKDEQIEEGFIIAGDILRSRAYASLREQLVRHKGCLI